MHRPTFDIFIGGPMGGARRDPAGLLFADHIGNMAAALRRIADEINQEQSALLVKVHTPELDDAGMITARVFGLIDTAELGVMDVSAGSPSVMYELAMLHALGVPTIPVVFRQADGARHVPYYLKDTYQAVVEGFDSDSLYAVLGAKVRNVITGSAAGADPSQNPMTGYYGLPLVDISASTGLATGYFHNFLRHLLRANGSVFDHLDDAIDQVVVLVPDSLAEAENLKARAERRLRQAGIPVELVGRDDGQVYTDRQQARGQMLIWRAGRYIFDAPAPLAAQETSPRMRRLRQQMRAAMARPDGSDEAQATIRKFEKKLIQEFINTLALLPSDYPGTLPDRLRFASLDQFIALAQAGG